MWPYDDHDENEYYEVIAFVEEYAQSLGAEYICTKEETFTTYSGNRLIKETLDMNIYKYGEEYFWVEHHYTPGCPFIVFSFGDSIDSVGNDDAEPFPYNLDEEELKAEVRYSMGIEDD
jgi:hypothetical protein